MDVAVILTYRCNSRCSMCHVWQNPSLPEEEVSLRTLDKIPAGIDYLNLTGGEPTLRSDLMEVVDLLYPRAMQLEISSNGLHCERLEPVVRKYPDVKIRLSLEGFEETNQRIRGEKDGFRRKVDGLLRLRELGGKDLGLAVTIQDGNAAELVELFRFAHSQGLELATSTLHNGFQFHKNDNAVYERLQVARQIEGLVTEMLRAREVKNWFRAYLNLGLIARVLGQKRLLPCTAGTDFLFVDPWGDTFACNVRPDLKLGSLDRQSWDEIVTGPAASRVREAVASCSQNCWMVGSAKTAMRHPRFARIPRAAPLRWVVENKLRVSMGRRVRFERYVDYSRAEGEVARPRPVPPPGGGSGEATGAVRRQVQSKDDPHYVQSGGFFNA